MSNVEWSPEQPPEWQPAPPPPPVEPQVTPLSLGQLLNETWEQVVTNFRFVGQKGLNAIAAAVGLGLIGLVLTYLFTTPDTQFLETVYSQSLASSDTELPTYMVGAFGFVFLVTLLSAIPQFWFTAITANRFLDPKSKDANGWVRLMLTNLLLVLWVLIALLPALAIILYGVILENETFLGGGAFLLFATIGVLLYFSLGFIPLIGVVQAEGLAGNKALKRSLELSKRSRFRMFVPLAIVTLLVAIATSAISQFGILVTDVLFGLVGFTITNAITIVLGALFSSSVSISIYRNQLRK